MLAYSLAPRNGSPTACLRLLHLDEQRVAVVAAHEERHPAPGAHAAHPDHLAGQVDELVLVQQALAVTRQRVAVLGRGRRAGGSTVSLRTRRRTVDSAGISSGGSSRTGACRRPRGQLGQRRFRWSFDWAFWPHGRWKVSVTFRLDLGPPAGGQAVGIELRGPDLEVAHGGESRMASGSRGTPGPRSTLRSGRRRTRGSAPATSMLAASRLRSHSNGPGSVSSKSLTSKIRSRSGEAKPPKLDQMGVAAQLDLERGGLGGQIGGHHRGGPPEEGEGRGGHPAVADRDQVGEPGGGLEGQDLQWIGPVGGGLPVAVAGPGHRPRPATEGRTLLGGGLPHGPIIPTPGHRTAAARASARGGLAGDRGHVLPRRCADEHDHQPVDQGPEEGGDQEDPDEADVGVEEDESDPDRLVLSRTKAIRRTRPIRHHHPGDVPVSRLPPAEPARPPSELAIACILRRRLASD